MINPPFGYNKDRQKRDFAINIYGNEAVNSVAPRFEYLKEFVVFNTIFAFAPADIGKYIITPLKADHDRSQNCVIFIIEDGEKKLLYGNDTGYFPDETWEYLAKNHTEGKAFDYVSLDTTSGMEECRHGHMGINCTVEVKERLIETGAADGNTVFCLNHFSHNGQKIYDELIPIAEKLGFIVSYDGMEVEI
jgi:phosphoribosyl 1,2-cyclic phosphate phosphodiesterase